MKDYLKPYLFHHTLFRVLVSCLTCASALCSFAQVDVERAWNELLQEMADEAVAGEDDADVLEGLVEDLNDLREHPLDINAAGKADLMRLPFLDAAQVDAILDYVALHGPLHDIGELLLAKGVGQREIRWLRICTHVVDADVAGSATALAARRKLRQELTTRLDVPLYERAGWSWARGLAHRWRYAARWRGWEAGARGEKDAGEPMFTRDIPLWDAMGAYICLRDAGRLANAIVGDYQASFGEGLVINQGFGFGKMLTQAWRKPVGFRPHRSSDEIHFLRGAAATVDVGAAIQLTAFGSVRRMDATINADNTTNGVVTTGLHRTPSELARRNSIWSHTAGLHAGWNGTHFGVGATALWQHYDHHLVRGKALYRQIYPEGTHFGNVSVDYSARWTRLLLRGETARSFSQGGGGWATLNRAALRLDPNTQLSLIQRFYSYHYYSAHARAFGESDRVQNESGVCLRADAERLGPFSVSAYFDLFYSPWPRYTMSHASTGFETYVKAGYAPNRHHAFMLNYRMKNKERNDVRGTAHSLRATYAWNTAKGWTLSAMAFVRRYRTEQSSSNGFAFAPRVNYGSSDSRLSASLSAMVFHTDDYDSRIALYEPTLTQTFGLIQLYGKGQRVAATLRCKAGRRLGIQAKVGATHYSDRDAIGSGPTLIESSWKGDVILLLRLQLR